MRLCLHLPGAPKARAREKPSERAVMYHMQLLTCQGDKGLAAQRQRNAVQALLAKLVELALAGVLLLLILSSIPVRVVLQVERHVWGLAKDASTLKPRPSSASSDRRSRQSHPCTLAEYPDGAWLASAATNAHAQPTAVTHCHYSHTAIPHDHDAQQSHHQR